MPIGWKQQTLLYSTDPGGLGPYTDHAASDALVAAAAEIWNVPVASISIGQGPALAEHVSGQNTFLSAGGVVWPADVAAANSASIPLAVVYDTDGSLTDLLLGSGASDPEECRQNAVSETVDKFDPAGYILHAIIILNGRCTGSAPEQQMQLRYQLERVFGRVLGLAWSQTNDNVYTGIPQPTYDQAEHWPLMHPLDILCGPYSFQCLPDPFTLRPDDVAGLVGIYPLAQGAVTPPGKQTSLVQANALQGSVTFPTGEGMAGMNVLVKRTPRFSPIAQDWFETSAVSGSSFRRNDVSAFANAGNDAEASFGASSPSNQGFFFIPYLAVIDPWGAQGEILSTEPINPLYIGEAGVGPYAPGIVSPAGSPPTPYGTISGPGGVVSTQFPIADAPATCGDGLDGSLGLPMLLPASGWWHGLICGYGHASYIVVPVRGGRSFTVEVTALDEAGSATTTKLMPVIALYAPDDIAESSPSLGMAPGAFNSLTVGTTALDAAPYPLSAPATEVRIGIADQRGDGRPDFPFQARFLYADSVFPQAVALGGGTITISGTGFREGNAVTVNGASAAVTSWTATSITAYAPPVSVAGATSGTAVEVAVTDPDTHGSSSMAAALTYQPGASVGDTLKLVSAQSAPVFAGDPAPVPFAVQLLGSDGVTPVAGSPVVFSGSPAGAIQFLACGSATCTVTTDSNGIAATGVIPEQVGTLSMQASRETVALNAEFEAVTKPTGLKLITAPAAAELVGVPSQTAFMVQTVSANETGISGQLITFQVTSGSAVFSGCNASPCSILTNVYGQAALQVIPTAPGVVTLSATDVSLSQTTSFSAAAHSPLLNLLTAPDATAFVGENGGVLKVQLLQADGLTPIARVPILFTAPAETLWSVCGQSVCVIDSDTNGQAASSIVTSSPGTVQVQAAYGSLAVSATTVVSVRAPALKILSAPSDSLKVGSMSSPFIVQLLDKYGIPMAGQQVSYGGVQGVVKMDCGLGSCIGTTNSNGLAGSAATPLQPGTIILNATWRDLNVTASFTALGSAEVLNPILVPPAAVYVGDKLTFRYQLLGPDGLPLKDHGVYFSVPVGTLAFDGCSFGTCGTRTDANGMVTATATPFVTGPLTVQATVDGITDQTSFTVLPKNFNVTIVSGGQQIVRGAQAVQPVVAKVTDAAGNPVQGTSVAVGQTVRAADLPCPPQGRCPAAPTLASFSDVFTTDTAGTISVLPRGIAGIATATAMAFSAGTQGFASTVVWRTP